MRPRVRVPLPRVQHEHELAVPLDDGPEGERVPVALEVCPDLRCQPFHSRRLATPSSTSLSIFASDVFTLVIDSRCSRAASQPSGMPTQGLLSEETQHLGGCR